MTGHGAKFGRKKEEAIIALLTQRNVDEAARSIGVAHKTLLRWMKEPEFAEAYQAARLRHMVNPLQGSSRLRALRRQRF
jgi:transposase-like protein